MTEPSMIERVARARDGLAKAINVVQSVQMDNAYAIRTEAEKAAWKELYAEAMRGYFAADAEYREALKE